MFFITVAAATAPAADVACVTVANQAAATPSLPAAIVAGKLFCYDSCYSSTDAPLLPPPQLLILFLLQFCTAVSSSFIIWQILLRFGRVGPIAAWAMLLGLPI